MPTFTFDTDAGSAGPRRFTADLPDVRAAQVAAVKNLGELLEEDGAMFWKEEVVTMTAFDGDHVPLFRLELSVALERSPLPLHARPSSPLGADKI